MVLLLLVTEIELVSKPNVTAAVCEQFGVKPNDHG